MKFGEYLSQNLTPEWRRAYIDYKSLKKLIKAVKAQQASSRFGSRGDSSDSDNDDGGRPPTLALGERVDAQPTAPSSSDSPTPRQQMQDEQAIQRLDELARKPSRSPRRSPRPASVVDDAGEASNDSSAASSLGRTTVPAAPAEEVKGYGSLERRSPATLSPALKTGLGRGGSVSGRSMKKVRLDDGAATVVPASPSVASARNPSLDDDDDGASRPTTAVQRLTPSNFLPPGAIPHPPSPAARPSPRTLEPIPASGAPSLRLTSPAGSTRPRDPSQPKPPASPWSLLPSPKLGATDDVRLRGRKASLASPILGDGGSGGPPRTGVLELFSDPPKSSKSSTKPPAHLDEVLPSLQPAETMFVDALDTEMSKVERFYVEREEEMRRRVDNLKLQCKELAEHRRIYHETHSENASALPQAAAAYLTSLRPILQPSKKAAKKGAVSHSPHAAAADEADLPLSDPHDAQHYDPEAYKRYKRKLRAATAEAYKGLELLKNFRILNLTGFRKALKKFEKASKISLMDAYNNDRISKQRFSNAYEIDNLIEELEDLYAARFEHGNKKTARERLRVQASTRSHHFSIFRSGILIGLAVPTAIHAIVLSFHADAHRVIPAWAGLLQVYGAFFLPVIFALLFFLNLEVWVRYRINYRFIFELDIRTVMDYREFLEIPAFLFFTLSFAFWFSFNRVGASNVSPTTWPLAWLVMTVVLFINPLPVMHRPGRFWLIRTLFRVLTPGYSRVEFAAFFLADELNSLIFSLYNIWFLGCAQSEGWPENVFSVCNNYNSWVVVVISILPPLARLLQCVQRWRESGVGIQLVNAGKYLATIVTFICFYLWRGRGSSQSDPSFAPWVIFASITSIYTSAWDLLIDWSVMNPKARLLRKQKIYTGRDYAYYFAIVTNVCIRFIWIGYVDSHGVLNLRLRSFVFYALEMLRRFQWNFYRVENEMLGNVDQYRVTRELPLPYDLNGQMRDDPDSSDGEDDPAPAASPRAGVRLAKVASDGMASRRRTAGAGRKAEDEETGLSQRPGPY